MEKFCLNLIVIFVFAICGANIVRSQNTEKAHINPPKWIWGGWSNLAESDLNKLETFVFNSGKINFHLGVGDKGQIVNFDEKFRDYEVVETIEPKLYRVAFTNAVNQYIYEFRICEDCYISSAKETALTYSVTENKKVLRDHLKSANAVLLRRTKRG